MSLLISLTRVGERAALLYLLNDLIVNSLDNIISLSEQTLTEMIKDNYLKIKSYANAWTFITSFNFDFSALKDTLDKIKDLETLTKVEEETLKKLSLYLNLKVSEMTTHGMPEEDDLKRLHRKKNREVQAYLRLH